LGWLSIFAVNLPIGMVGLWLASRYVDETQGARSRDGIAAGVLNATRQTGSVIGVALFGAIVSHAAGFVTGAHAVLFTCIALLLSPASIVAFDASGGMRRFRS
jgi:DHA2 family methylenomycin A resistance protein-like MFS transporter